MKNNNFILLIIKYTPAVFILLLSIPITYYLINDYNYYLLEQKSKIKKNYIELNKETIYTNIDNTVSKYIIKTFKDSEDALKKDLKLKINIVHKIATNIYNKNKDSLSKEEIIRHIKNSIEILRFNEGHGYFSLHTIEGINILHPIYKNLEGKSVLNRKDSRGNYPVQEAISIAKTQGEGFMNWYYFKPNQIVREFEKIGIVKKFEPYNLIITTAVFKDEFEKTVKEKVLNHLSNIKYKNDGYIFVLDFEGNVLVHKNEILNKINIFKTKRLNTFKRFINSTKEDKFVEYKITDPKPHLKISYIKKIELLNWVVGTGFNLEEVNSLIKKEQEYLEKEHKKHLNTLLLWSLIITCLLLILSYLASKYIKKIFLNYEEALIKKEKLKFESIMKELKDIFDNLPMMVVYKDTKNNILSVNKNLADTIDKSVDELKVPVKNIFPNNYEKFYNDDLEIIKTKKPIIGRIEEYEIKGKVRLIESTKIPVFDEKGNVENIIIFAVDITEKEKLQIQNEKQETLLVQQSKFATMGEMLSNIAHQWKQPLTIISAATTSTQLQKELGILTDKELSEALNSINDSTQYLAQTIEDFRNFFKPDKNRFEEICFSKIVDQTQKLLESKFKIENIEIVRNIENINIISLENGLIQVLINILNNARDELIKRDSRKLIFINFYKKDDSIFIEVKDNAGGISETNINKVFNAYFTTKGDNEGTGIGLFMSKNIVTKLLNGEIYVKNETYIYDELEYTGAKFIIKL